MSIATRIRQFLDARAEHAAEQLLRADMPVIHEWEAGVQLRIGLTKNERAKNREIKRASRATQFFRKARKVA